MAQPVVRESEPVDDTLRLARETLRILRGGLLTVQEQIDRSHVAVADSRELLKQIPTHPLR